MENSQTKSDKVIFSEQDALLIEVTEKNILNSFKGETDFRDDEDWPESLVHLSALGANYVALKDGKFSYLKTVPTTDFDLIIDVDTETKKLSPKDLSSAAADYDQIREKTGFGEQVKPSKHIRYAGVKAQNLF